jgi:thiamine-phosphate pyrophosphorylase
MIGDRMILGVSASNSAEARKAAEAGADYVGVGAVFATATKATSVPIGLEKLTEVVRESPLPVVAIGGINHDNVTEVLESGCAGVVVVSCVFGVDDVEGSVRTLRARMGLNEAVATAD